MRALALLGRDRVDETTGDQNSSGFGIGRSTADAIGQCYQALAKRDRAAWVLEGDIRSCFEHPSCYSVPVPGWPSVGGSNARTRSSVAGSSGKR